MRNEPDSNVWLQWHSHYDTPNSSLAHRLTAVRDHLRRALVEAPCDAYGGRLLISVCAGEGRDVLPVLAERDGSGVRAVLVELDPSVSQRAYATATELGLSGVEVRHADAATVDTYGDLPPAHVLLICGVFGHTSVDDAGKVVATLPALLAPGGIVIWTRACRRANDDPSLGIRDFFLDHGFTELSFCRTADDVFRVGMHQLTAIPAGVRPPRPGTRMFTFV
jgi:SAM-dependent methyltransferase